MASKTELANNSLKSPKICKLNIDTLIIPQGLLIHEKYHNSKISCYCPFNDKLHCIRPVYYAIFLIPKILFHCAFFCVGVNYWRRIFMRECHYGIKNYAIRWIVLKINVVKWIASPDFKYYLTIQDIKSVPRYFLYVR